MPRLRQFCLIKDTNTGKYLVNTGSRGYYGKPRRPGWSENGNFYKITRVNWALHKAARTEREAQWYATNPDALTRRPDTSGFKYGSPEFEAALKPWRDQDDAIRQFVAEAGIPENWVVIQFAIGPQGETTETPAREWKN